MPVGMRTICVLHSAATRCKTVHGGHHCTPFLSIVTIVVCLPVAKVAGAGTALTPMHIAIVAAIVVAIVVAVFVAVFVAVVIDVVRLATSVGKLLDNSIERFKRRCTVAVCARRVILQQHIYV